MPKLHELLAVETNVKGQATKTRTELMTTFEKKRHLFEETRKTFEPNLDGAQTEVVEQKDIQSTVKQEIDWISRYLAKALDVAYQVDVANTLAKADVVTEDGDILLKEVPATALLQLEKRVKEVQELITAIPTLDPAKGFKPDADRGFGYFRARDVRKEKTRKEDKPITIAKATDKHPEQAVLKTYDVPIGHLLEQEWSSLITPAKKAELLDRVEILFRAVTKARAKANETSVEVENNKIGTALLDFVFQPLSVA